MLTSNIIINTLPNGVVFFALQADDTHATSDEKKVGGLVDAAIKAAGEFLLEQYKNGEMVESANLEQHIKYALKRAMQQ